MTLWRCLCVLWCLSVAHGASAPTSVEVRLVRPDAVLAATLDLPAARQPVPGVVLLSGSGPATRAAYRDIARFYARHGVAVLSYDQRGAGASGGRPRFAFADLVGDALAAAAYLRARPEIDSARLGLWGLSQGGWIAPLAAARDPRIAFVVAVSASGVPPAQQELWRLEHNLRRGRATEASVRTFARAWRTLCSSRALPWPPTWRGALVFPAPDFALRPPEVWREVGADVLLVYGELDKSVPPRASARLIEAALAAGGRAPPTLLAFPGADHSLRRSRTGYQFEAPPGDYAPGYLSLTARWMRGEGVTSRAAALTGVSAERLPSVLPRFVWGTFAVQLALWGLAPLGLALASRSWRRGGMLAGLQLLTGVVLAAFVAQVVAAEGIGLDQLGGVPWLWGAAVFLGALTLGLSVRCSLQMVRRRSWRNWIGLVCVLAWGTNVLVYWWPWR